MEVGMETFISANVSKASRNRGDLAKYNSLGLRFIRRIGSMDAKSSDRLELENK